VNSEAYVALARTGSAGYPLKVNVTTTDEDACGALLVHVDAPKI
jgi:hypothetical protein